MTYKLHYLSRRGMMLLLLLTYSTINYSQIITTIAGSSSTGGYGGDGSNATSAQLNYPSGVAADATGIIYVADLNNNRIRKISTSGIISTFAGTGTAGYSGDGGSATSANISGPYTVIADASGNVYFTDDGNSRIRKVSSSGIITTVAGNGSSGFAGDGGPATSAKVNQPAGLTTDATGNLYFADTHNNRIRKVSTSGIVTTIAGNGTSGFGGDGGSATAAMFNLPTSIVFDVVGNLYVADAYNYRVRKIDASGIITTVAGNGSASFSGDGGSATSAGVNCPNALIFDSRGNLFVSDFSSVRIRKINTSGVISTFAGNGSGGFSGDGGNATAASLLQTRGVSVDRSDNLFIADCGNNRIRKISACTLPAIGNISGATSVCEGSTIVLTDTPSGGTWVSANPLVASVDRTTGVVYGITSGSAAVRYIVTNSCGSDSVTRTIIVNSIPFAGTVSGIDSVCPGDTVRLADTVAGGTWSSSNTTLATVSTSGLVRGITSGSITISYVVSNACGSDIATYSFHVRQLKNCPNSIDQQQVTTKDISISPNPGKGTFILSVSSSFNATIPVIITDMLGRKVMEFTAETNKEKEIKTDIPAGIYFIAVVINGDRVASRLVIE